MTGSIGHTTGTTNPMHPESVYLGDSMSDPVRRFGDDSVDLMICDPPFGIKEATFDKHYNRDGQNVIEGYCEAPGDYYKFTLQWMRQAKRVMRTNASMYVVIGHTNLRHVLNAAAQLRLHEINHAIWKYNFGVSTKKKFVTSHYHVLYYAKSSKSKPTFNTYCRFSAADKNDKGGSLLYADLEDVFVINKEYATGEVKNQNKLPFELIEKLILYSSKPGDAVCDLFLGNFTTAIAAKALGRIPMGMEKNEQAFAMGLEKLKATQVDSRLKELVEVDPGLPANQGKPFDEIEVELICKKYARMKVGRCTKKQALFDLGKEFGRGPFGINNLLAANAALVDRYIQEFVRERTQDIFADS